MFRKQRHLTAVEPAIDLAPSEVAITEAPDPLERSRTAVAHLLDTMRRKEQALVSEIGTLETELWKTRESIAGFELAEARWETGGAPDVDRPMPANGNGLHQANGAV